MDSRRNVSLKLFSRTVFMNGLSVISCDVKLMRVVSLPTSARVDVFSVMVEAKESVLSSMPEQEKLCELSKKAVTLKYHT